jgi:hypothetical protein
MSAHTPGPWRLVDDAQGPFMVMHPTRDGVAIANLGGDAYVPANGYVEIGGPGAPERTANARLIAPAPELLSALAETNEVLGYWLNFIESTSGNSLKAWQGRARDAIHKANIAITDAIEGKP